MIRFVLASLAALFALAPRAAAAQADGVQVSLSSALVKLGEPVGIFVRVEGDVTVRFGTFPDVTGLEFSDPVRSGTQRSVSYDTRGRPVVKQRTTYQIRVRPEGLGTYTIPPIPIEVDGALRSYPDEPMVLEVVADIEASRLLLFERESVPEVIYEGEPYTLDLRFGWDRTRNFADAELQLPWWDRQDGVIELEAPASQRGAYRVPVRPGRQEAEVEDLGDVRRGPQSFKVFRLRRRFVATRPGTVEFGRSLFRFYETVGRSGGVFSRGQTRALVAPIEPFSIEVRPVPEEGRPIEWTGAVGDLSVSREVLRRDVDLGDVVELEVRWTGDGNLEFFDAPDLGRVDAFRGFRVLAVDDEKRPDERVVTYDLVPLDPKLDAIPPVPLPVFDTREERYVSLETEPVPIRVTVPEGAADDPFGPEDESDLPPDAIRDIVARPSERSATGVVSQGPGAAAGAIALVLALAGWIGLRRAVRRRGDPASVEERRRRGALGRLAADARGAGGPAELSRALELFLARRTGEPEEAWIGRGHLRDFVDVEVSDSLESEYARLRADLDRAVFGGEGTADLGPDRLVRFGRAAAQEGLR